MRYCVSLLLLAITLPTTSADSIDWVNVQYILQARDDSFKSAAREGITRAADITAKKGPWTVGTGSNTIKPPSGSVRDYLSWAPYHWPDCNWCAGARTHLASGANRTHHGGEEGSSSSEYDSMIPDENSTFPASPTETTSVTDGASSSQSANEPVESDSDSGEDIVLPFDVPIFPDGMPRMKRMRRQEQEQQQPSPTPTPTPPPDEFPSFPPVPNLTSLLYSATHTAASSTSEDNVISGTVTAAQAPAKTGKPKPTKTKGQESSKASCTPSPTKSLPPSATWTMCPYVVRDGRVNPDVRNPHAVQSVVELAQAIQYNGFAYAFTSSATYAASVTKFIKTFFLDPKVGMNPSIKFGQVIRGPGKQEGQYLGILDFRGMVKIANAVKVLKASGTGEWSADTDKQFKSWMSGYANWLTTSDIGKKGSAAPNNHGSFYAAQLAGVSYAADDKNAAIATLNKFFKNQFLDQIAASGEQPFEAVRTRPYHYRCFNLEALITSAKLGDELGLDLWNAKSKYGATIQTALDFIMAQNPKQEDVSDIFPHVAAVAAAYGDPKGNYDKFLRMKDKNYGKAPYYFYNSPKAFRTAPSAGKASNSGTTKGGKGQKGKNKSEVILNARLARKSELEGNVHSGDVQETPAPGHAADSAPDVGGIAGDACKDDSQDSPNASIPPPPPPFECPAAFAEEEEVQLDDGEYVTCDELKPFFENVKNTAV